MINVQKYLESGGKRLHKRRENDGKCHRLIRETVMGGTLLKRKPLLVFLSDLVAVKVQNFQSIFQNFI